MTGRRILALTNSDKAADIVAAAAAEDFPESVQRKVVWVDWYGWHTEISVDADEFERWVRTP